MITVPLTNGQVAIIDDEDAERVLAYKWFAKWCRRGRRWYAIRAVGPANRRRSIPMHRFILDAPPNKRVDHINQDGLDNRRSNLRLATNSQNGCNRKAMRNNSTGLKGVWPNRQRGKFGARIQHLGIRYHLGYYDTAEAAARAYDEVAQRLHGEFACVNFPEISNQCHQTKKGS
jgi:hypothetical protein